MTYLELIQRAPLKAIKNAKSHESALDLLTELVNAYNFDVDKDVYEYCCVLSLLIDEYEKSVSFKNSLFE